MALFRPSFGFQSHRRKSKKKLAGHSKLVLKSRRPLLAETLEGRWMLDATIVTDSTLYPLTSPPAGNTLASVVFNESETMAAGTAPAIGSTVNLQTGTIGIFYTDERAMTLGVSQVTVKTAGGSTTTNYPVTPFPTLPNGTVAASATNPQVGAPYTPPTNLSTLPIQPGTDPSGRPMFPSLYVTDITGLSAGSVAALSGDWQFGGSPQTPTAVFGTWKSVTETIDDTTSPPSVSFNVPNDPAQNKWDLGPGADPAPTSFQNQGYGAEAQWTLGSVVDQNGNHLIPGHSYRFYFMVHDGDQNKVGGDVGQAAFDLMSPITPTINTMTGGSVVLGSGAKLTDSAMLSNGNNPTGTITFNLYAPSDTTFSSPVYTTTVPVSGNGAYSVNGPGSSNPGGFLPTVAGNYEWVASYSGDTNNSPTSSGKGNEPETVVSAPTISTSPSGTVALGSANKLNDTATLAGGANAGSITFYLFAPGVVPNAANSNNVYSDTVTVTGDGNYSTSAGTNPGGYLPTASGTYQWVAVYSSSGSSPSILGAAGNFAVLGLSGSTISITNPSTTINGNVGLGPNGTQNFSDGTINGNYEVDPTANNSQSNNVVVTGTTTSTDLSTAANDASTASTTINAMAPTQLLGAITGPETIFGNGGVNVIDVSQINLSSGAITFSGGPNDIFYVNDPGSLQISGPSAIVLNGVTPNQVIFNATGGGTVQFSGSSEAQGIFLAVDRSIERSNGMLNGAIIGGENSSIAITSGATINFPSTPPTTVTSPFGSEPANVVDASIAISPLTPVNEVNHAEMFTISVTAVPAGTGAPTFALPTVAFPNGTPGTVGPVTLVGVNGNVATYTETINNATAGTFTVQASGTVTMGGLAVTRTTGDNLSGDSASAVKNYVDANIAISPLNPVNEVGSPETFTITVTASPANTGAPTFALPTVTFPTGAPGTVGPVTPIGVNGDVATYSLTINSAVTGTFEVKASDTVTMGGLAVTRTTGDGISGDSPDAVKNYVNAGISITPPTPVNEVNHQETFTITLVASPANGGVPTFGTPVISFPSGTPATVGAVSAPTINGNTATYTVSIDNPTAGTFDVKATAMVTIGGVVVTRSTGDGLPGDSPDAVKNYVDANIAITPPTPVNEVNHAETFTITVTALPAATGAPTFALPTVAFPNGTPGTVGPVTLVGINGDVATYTETINNATAGTFTVQASGTVTMGGVAVTRTTGDNLSGDSASAVKNYVDANIAISPLNPVNEVGSPETFTITVTASPANTGAPTFALPTVTFPTGAPGTVGPVTPIGVNGDVATYSLTINSAVTGTFEVKASDTVTMGGLAVTRTTGDGLSGDSPDAVKNYVNAGISITPPTPVNEVNHQETFTVTLIASPANGGVPTFGTPVISFPSGTPATVGAVSAPTINGNTATYTVSIDNPTAGTFDVKATAMVTIGGVVVTRSTGDGLPGDSPDAVKNYVDAKIAITPPTPVNEVNHSETFTITVTALPAATGAPTFALPTVAFPNGTPGTVGPVTLVGINGDVATYTETINNATAGTFTVQASDTVTMGGVAVTRTTGDNLSGDSASGVKNYVDANIAISPLNPVNEVGSPETFTITVTASPASTGAPTFALPTVTFPTGAPGTVGPVTPIGVNGDVATYSLTINSAVTGTFEVKASDTVTMGGLAVTRTTGDGISGDSPDAVKNYVNAGISITPPTPVNEVNHQEIFTVTLIASPANGGVPTFGTPVISFPSGTPATVGAVSAPTINGNTATYTVSIDNPTAGTFDVKATAMVTIGGVVVTRSTGDGLPGDSPDAVKNYVDANIAITPPSPVNEVNHAETFTITVTALPAATGAPTFALPTVTFPNGTPGTVGPVTLVGVIGNVATYTETINNATAGTFTVEASDTVTMGGVAVTRTTGDNLSGDSSSGVKNYVDANIAISPLNPVNAVNHPETFTITVTASPAATGAPTFALPTVTFPNGAPGTVGPVTLVSISGDVATYTETINSAVPGVFTVVASDMVTMGGVTVTRTTGDGLSGDSPSATKTYKGLNITTTPGGTVTLGSGQALSDTATLSGGNNPTGTVTFYLFAPGVVPDATDSNNVYSEVAPLSGLNASTGTGASSGSAIPTQAGTYEWVAVYNGDLNNSSVASNFGDEPQVVSAGQAQVVVFKVPDQQQIDAGQTAGFTIKILNEGANTATGVTLTDPLPAGVGDDINWQIDASGTGFGAGTNPSDFAITGPVGHQVLALATGVTTVAAGASISVHITGQTSLNDVDPNLPPCTTTLINTATVNAANEPANEQNAQATATITLHNVDVDVSKTADQTPVVAGQMAGFTIQVYNQGCIDAAGLTLDDQLPEGPGNDIFWRIDPTHGSPENFKIVGQIGSQVLEFSSNVTDLQPGSLISVHIVGQTSSFDVGTLNNTVTVNASNEPSFEQNAQASASITVVQGSQGDPTSLYVQAAFEQALYRAPDQATLQAFVNALESGAMSRLTFATTLTHSSEYYNDVITLAYAHFLGRTPDSQGLQFWNQQLQSGLTDEELEAQFIGSPEYYQHSGGTDKAWVDNMYFDLLGRMPDSQGENYWIQALANGASRSSVALGFAASAEREGDQVKDDYQIFLGRLPAQSEIDSWVTAFENGLTNEDVIAGFIASDEYFNRHS